MQAVHNTEDTVATVFVIMRKCHQGGLGQSYIIVVRKN